MNLKKSYGYLIIPFLLMLFTTFSEAGSVTVSNSTINLGENTLLKAVGYDEGDSFIWKTGLGYQEVYSTEKDFHFNPKMAGTYIVELGVNGKSERNITINVLETTDTTTLNGGEDKTICLGSVAELLAKAPKNTTLQWTIDGEVYANGPVFYFNPTEADVYTIKVKGGGQEDTVVVTVNNCSDDTNHAPVANAGADQTVTKGATVQLDGSESSDADGDTLTYKWSIVNKPAGSSATLSDDSIVSPTFVVDVNGTYTLQLIVNDGEVDSVADTVTIHVSDDDNDSPVPTCINPTKLTPVFD